MLSAGVPADGGWWTWRALPLHAAWLPPIEGDLDWAIPAAAVILQVPFYFMSVWVEERTARRLLREQGNQHARRWSVKANLLSYALTTAILLILLAVGIVSTLSKRGSLN